MIEYLAWTADRETFVFTMGDLVNPVTGTPLASLGEDGVTLIPSEGCRIDEIGEIVKGYDEETGEPTEIVAGHHVNLVAYGPLADAIRGAIEQMNAGKGVSSEGQPEWFGIFPLLGTMSEVPSEDGVPAGWAGASGMRIYPSEGVTHRVRVWA